MKHSNRLLPALAVGLLFAMSTPAIAIDNDGDGVEAEFGDCNDNNPTIHPGAVEQPGNEVDEDCDAQEQCFVDADNDVYRTSNTVVSTDIDCADAGEARAADPTGDCDDGDPDINPGATEVCDDGGVDDDCDSAADCDDSACSSEPSCAVQVFDHLECFKIKTTEKFKATLDVDPGVNPPFPVAAGCTIGKATKYCVPVMRTVAVVDESSTLTGGSATVGQDLTDDRICYKVKCPDTDTTSITITGVDRFGNREFTKLKTSEICTPAAQAP